MIYLPPNQEKRMALKLIQTAIYRLGRYDLNLCKVQSNAQLVRDAYPTTETLPEIINLKEGDMTDLEEESTSLGLQWHIKKDTFSIKIKFKDRPKTKRGLLGHIMSVYDPQGIAAPAMLSCKLLQREIFPRKEEDPHCTHALGWDDPIPAQFHKQWAAPRQLSCRTYQSAAKESLNRVKHCLPPEQTYNCLAVIDQSWQTFGKRV